MFLAHLLSAILQIGSAQVNVEIADTASLRNQGLMERTSLNGGMLFVYEKPEPLCFWMKNTKIPLSIGFFDAQKTLCQIEDMDPPLSERSPLRLYKSRLPMQYALEVPKHWFEHNNIQLGEKFTLLDSSKQLQ